MQGVIDVNPGRLESLYVGGKEHPYVQFGQVEPAIKLVHQGEEYWYYRTVPLKGYGAILPRHIRELEAGEKKPFLARFGERIYIYATGVTPIGAGRPPGA